MDLKRWFQFCCIKILLLFSTIGIVLSHRTCMPGLIFPGYTVPSGDIIIEYGQPLDITCVLHNSSGLKPNASSYLTFFRNNETIPSQMIEILNSTAIKLHIDKPPKVSGDIYTCRNDNNSVCLNFVTVGTKPQQVTDFQCIGYNYENLTCTWTPPQNFVKTDYNLTYGFLQSRSSRSEFVCPELKVPEANAIDQRMSCFWNVSTTPQYRQVQSEFYFTLKMKNKFGENKYETTFMHFSHILSGPPENLEVLSATPTSINLHWNIPRSMGYLGVHHRILYQCENEDGQWHFGGQITTRPKEKEKYFNLTNLKHAHTLCDIRVALRCQTALPGDETMWSKNASVTAWTSSAIPNEPPKTDIGSFEVVNIDIQFRDVYIYWQQIPEVQKNGPEFRYRVQVEGNPDLRPVENSSAYAKFKNLSISTSYRFNIWSENINGTSLHKSTVTVPKQVDRVKEIARLTNVEFGGGRYELTWEAPERPKDQKIDNYTIFWCKNKRERPHQCKGQLNWTVIPADRKGYNATISEDGVFQFAISANGNKGSSGMVWAGCTILHDKHMGKMKSIWINRVGPTFIEVGWKLECSDRIGSVKGFIIYYCPIKSPSQTECKGPQQNITFDDGNRLGGNVTDLSPYTTYMLTVAVITQHTTYSQQSDPLYNTTNEAEPGSPPQDFRVTNVSNSSISLSWKPPTAINGVLKYYKIEFTNETIRDGELQIDPVNNYTMENLGSFGTYHISIRACTVACSKNSRILNVTTKLGYPGRINKPTVDRRNDTAITIVWPRPSRPNGKNEYYNVQFKQKHQSENKTLEFNVTEQKYVLENCGDGGKYNTFYVSVRAVNIINDQPYRGPWSDELENYCYTPVNYIAYILSFLVIIFLFAMAFLFNRLYKHCKIMRDVQIKLPPGLAPIITDHTLVAWNTEKQQENRDSHPPPDEKLPLVEIMNKSRHISGDSSGCSSGHESVTSSLESGTHISSSSDSGTEQPGNYCVLGVDPKADSAYVPVTADSNKVPYKTCDVSSESSPYVMTGDAVKTINPGYIPFNQSEPIKTSGYVVAGIKNCNGYIPFNQTETVNRNTGYVVAGIKNCKLD